MVITFIFGIDVRHIRELAEWMQKQGSVAFGYPLAT